MKLINSVAVLSAICISNVTFASSPSANDFFNSLYAQAFFLEQCIAKKILPSTGIHNKNIRKATSLGYSPNAFWEAGTSGAKGLVFDMIKNNWVRVPMDRTNCKFVQQEQEKFNEENEDDD